MPRKTEITSREAAKNFGACQDTALGGPIIITKNGKPHTVLLAYEDYRRMASEKAPKSSLAMISAEFTRELRAKGHPGRGKPAGRAFIDSLYEDRPGDVDFSRTDIEPA